MDSVVSAITLILIAVHALLLIFALIRGRKFRAGLGWLMLAIIASAGALASYLIPADATLATNFGRGFVLALTLAVLVIAQGRHGIADLDKRKSRKRTHRIWLLLSLVWLVGLVGAATISPNTTISQAGWLATLFNIPDALSLVLLGGLGIMGAYLLIYAFYNFYQAMLPEVANRALFWVLVSALVITGCVMVISGSIPLVLAGGVVLLLGAAGATYAHVAYRLIDVRGILSVTLRVLGLVALTSGVIFVVAWFARTLEMGAAAEALLLIGLVAVLAGALYVGLRQFIEFIAAQLARRSKIDPAQATRNFSQQVSKAIELDQLVTVAAETLATEMRARRAGLLLISDTAGNSVQLRVMQGGGFGGDMKDVRGNLSKKSQVYQDLAGRHESLLQFDLEFSPQYADWDESERQFFSSLQMSAYAPIILENALIGILACGPKINDTAFNRDDLDLLLAMAHQTGVALRNARLVADLRHLNSSMRALNKVLEEGNTQMEKLDAVKTDFITIASHELRTPLAQIRGYTDIIDALNEQGMLNQDQIGGLVANLRKATERMEELIAAMLDVSQIDVNAMDLRFTQTTPESVVRMAIEPLTDAIKQRKLTLSARGLRGLPPIQADTQRLVQAFRNIVVNAIKFTPDGGRIEINAELQPAPNANEIDHVLVSIKDTGVGIAKENLDLVFKKFFRAYDPQLHSTGTYKFMGAGPGLGLTIAKGVIEGHGGKVWAESPGHDMQSYPGTTFFVLLPVSPPEGAKRVMPFEQTGEAVPTA